MIVPGNMRERPRGLDRAALIRRMTDIIVAMCTETIELQGDAFNPLGNSRLEEGAVLEILDRLVVARAQIDIIRRIIKSATGHEIHDSH